MMTKIVTAKGQDGEREDVFRWAVASARRAATSKHDKVPKHQQYMCYAPMERGRETKLLKLARKDTLPATFTSHLHPNEDK